LLDQGALYPVFSPRAPGLLVMATWTIVLAYLTDFVVWQGFPITAYLYG
jgi:hypothetical protein